MAKRKGEKKGGGEIPNFWALSLDEINAERLDQWFRTMVTLKKQDDFVIVACKTTFGNQNRNFPILICSDKLKGLMEDDEEDSRQT